MRVRNQVEQVRAALQAADIYVLDQTDVPHGVRLSLHNDAVVTVYDSGKVLVQGKHQDSTKAALAALGPATPSTVWTKVAPADKTPLVLPHGWRSCPQCEQLLSTTRQYCIRCGAEQKLADNTEPCAACGEQIDRAWSYCQACGAALDF